MAVLILKPISLTAISLLFVHETVFCFSNTTDSNSTSNANTTDVKSGRDFEDGNCHFDDDFCIWSNENDSDDFDWIRQAGKTPSGNTGPKTDRGGEGYYVYAEVSWPRKPGETARLVAGPFSGAKCMRFYYHMFGRYIADLQIYLRENGMESFIWGRYKNQGDVWRYSNVTVFGQNYTVVMVARVGQSYQGDIAVDDITFVNGTCDGKALNNQPRLKNLSIPKQQKGEPGSCNFDGGFCEWINLPLGDQFDWTLNSGETGTRLTGPSEDHTGNQGGYIYIEASEPQKHKHAAHLLGPRLCGRMCLKFFYSMNGKRMGAVNVYKREGMGSDDLLWSMTGDQGTEWHEALVDIGGACYQIIFEGIVGATYLSDAAVDDIFFTKGTCCELKMESFDAGVVGNCTFEEGMCEWRNDATDDLEWELIEGETLSEETGPSAGYSGQGQYIYVESSEPHRAGGKAVLVGGILRGLQCMRFKYYMYGVDMGSLSVYRIGDGIMRYRLWRRHGDQGQMWHEARITLSCSSFSYMLEIEAVIGAWRSDIAIDNIEFTKGACPPRIYHSTVLPTTTAATSPWILADAQSESNCSFAGQFCNWKNDYTDDFDWLINSGQTMTKGTGPSADADDNGGYIYLEASLQTVDQKARLISGDLSDTQCMQFHYHMWGFGIGSLRVNQVDQKRKRPRILWFKTGNQGRRWHQARLNLFGRVYKVVIEGVRGHTFYGDIAIDAIGFTSGRCKIEEVSQEEILADSHLGTGVCSFEKNFCRWRNEETDDQFDWKITEGETPSKGTGPQNGFGGLGKYAFIESSVPRRKGDIAILHIYGSGKDRCLFFAYHMWGSGVGSLSVYQQRLDWDLPPTALWSRKGDHGSAWNEAQVSVKGYHKYKLIIEAVRGKNYRGDIAIDEVGFYKGLCGKRSN